MSWKEEIRHVVVLMLENRSFDHLLGFLRLDDPSQRLEGLSGDETVPAVIGRDPGRVVRVRRAAEPAAYVTEPTPGHQFADVTMQLFGREDMPDPPVPTMDGFVMNYARQPGHDGQPVGTERAAAIMDCLDSALLPAISTLARNFVVCDRWFSSVPGPTWPNRFFVHAATAGGLIESPTNAEQIAGFLGGKFRMRTIYENLQASGWTWAVYFVDHAQAFALANLHRYADDGFRRLETFATDVAEGMLPNYTFIEPVYLNTLRSPSSDQHPPHHLLEGERLIAWVYDTLRSNEALWRQSLLVVLYDEHGGFYDHVPPPAAVPPDDISAMTPDFGFDRLGLRVPAVLVSPWARKGVADHRTYDHTALLATVKKLFRLPHFLTRRDAEASAFDDAGFLDAPRAAEDMPSNLGALVPAGRAGTPERAPSDLQQSLVALGNAVRRPGIGGPRLAAVIDRLRAKRR